VFDQAPLSDVLAGYKRHLANKVANMSDDEVLSRSEDEWVEALIANYDVECPALADREQWQVDDHGSGERPDLIIPFTGHGDLFKFTASQFGMAGPPQGRVTLDNELVLTLQQGPGGAGLTQEALDRAVEKVERYLGFVEKDLAAWRPTLADTARREVAARIARARSYREGIASLGIPVRRREDAPKTFTGPGIVRREPPPLTGGVGTAGDEPGPALSDEYYEHILSVIRAAGHAMERSPKTYERWGEEDRRQVLILMLNTHYTSDVYAEAFNSDGKTDILIRAENDLNVFIAECKFWSGPEGMTKTISQLWKYVTWRDVKLAIILFVDRKNMTAAVRSAKETLGENERWRAWLSAAEEGEFRAQMALPGDDERLVTLHVSMFDTPRTETEAEPDDGEERAQPDEPGTETIGEIADA
jgi:hypothetical protein